MTNDDNSTERKMLSQPINGVVSGARNILLAGCGGGYDVMGAIPLAAELIADGRSIHLASLSFSNLSALGYPTPVRELPNLFDLHGVARTHLFLDSLAGTETIQEVTAYIEGMRKSIRIKDRSVIPI